MISQRILWILLLTVICVQSGNHRYKMSWKPEDIGLPERVIYRVFREPKFEKNTSQIYTYTHTNCDDRGKYIFPELDQWCGWTDKEHWLTKFEDPLKHSADYRPRYISASVADLDYFRRGFYMMGLSIKSGVFYDIEETMVIGGCPEDAYSDTFFHEDRQIVDSEFARSANEEQYVKNLQTYNSRFRFETKPDSEFGAHELDDLPIYEKNFCWNKDNDDDEAKKFKKTDCSSRYTDENEEFLVHSKVIEYALSNRKDHSLNEVVISPLPQNVIGFFSHKESTACAMKSAFQQQHPLIAKTDQKHITAWEWIGYLRDDFVYHRAPKISEFHFIPLTCDDKYTPLHWAAEQGKETTFHEILKFIYRKKMDKEHKKWNQWITTLDQNNNTPLMLADAAIRNKFETEFQNGTYKKMNRDTFNRARIINQTPIK